MAVEAAVRPLVAAARCGMTEREPAALRMAARCRATMDSRGVSGVTAAGMVMEPGWPMRCIVRFAGDDVDVDDVYFNGGGQGGGGGGGDGGSGASLDGARLLAIPARAERAVSADGVRGLAMLAATVQVGSCSAMPRTSPGGPRLCGR